MRCEPRTLDDIRALGGNDLEDERRFAGGAALGNQPLALPRLRPAGVRAMVTPAVAEAMQRLHPLRTQYEAFGPGNPFMAGVERAAELVRDHRKPASQENAFLAMQEQVSNGIVESLETWRKAAERASEETFRTVYGSPALQAALGIDAKSTRRPRKAAKSVLHGVLVEKRIGELRAAIARGGPREALVRSILYVGQARGGADERGFEAVRRLRRDHAGPGQLSLSDFKALIREQYFILAAALVGTARRSSSAASWASARPSG
jgi:hypothetical protein